MSLNNFINKIKEEEIIELNDILEYGHPQSLIESNIKYIMVENKIEDVDIKVDITEKAENAVMGYYNLNKNGESFEGVFIADGYLKENKFDLLSLNLGDKDLKYWGK